MMFRIIDQHQYYLFFSKLLERLMFNRLIHFYLTVGYLQKLKMVSGKGNALKQQFNNLYKE